MNHEGDSVEPVLTGKHPIASVFGKRRPGSGGFPSRGTHEQDKQPRVPCDWSQLPHACSGPGQVPLARHRLSLTTQVLYPLRSRRAP